MAKKNGNTAQIISDDQLRRLVVSLHMANQLTLRPRGYDLFKKLGELAEKRPRAFDDLVGKGKGEDARLLDQVQMALQARSDA